MVSPSKWGNYYKIKWSIFFNMSIHVLNFLKVKKTHELIPLFLLSLGHYEMWKFQWASKEDLLPHDHADNSTSLQWWWGQCSHKCGPRSSSISVTWDCWECRFSGPKTYCTRHSGGGPAIVCQQPSSRCGEAWLNLRTHGAKQRHHLDPWMFPIKNG